MGEQAVAGAMSNYKSTIRGMKRLVGLDFNDPRAQKEMSLVPFQCVPIKHASGGPDSVGVQVNFNDQETVVSLEAIFGMMVKHLGEIAAAKAKSTAAEANATLESLFPQDWVLAIPNYFTDAQRRAVLAGCEISGITGVQRLMHENTAVALAYGIFKDLKKEFTKDKPSHIMFIDMGASQYTCSVAVFEPGKLTVKAAYCDENLGGRDFDMLIAEWLAAKFAEKFGKKLTAKPMDRPKTRMKLLAAAEKAKKTLSPQGVKEARINLEMLQDDLDFSATLTAKEYEAMCQPLLARLAAPLQMCLTECKLQVKDLDSVEIVGGSTRIGCVKRELTKALGKGAPKLATTMNADEAVARGAALQSAILSPRFKVLPYEIQEAQPYPIRVSWAGDDQAGVEVDPAGNTESAAPADSVIMFDRGLSFPIVRRVTLKREGTFPVNVMYDESASITYGLPKDSGKHICNFGISLPSEGEKKVRVNIKQDIHGIVHMSSAQMVEEVEEPPAPEEEKSEEEKADAPAEGEEKKKVKIKKTNLEFTVSRPLDWTREEITSANEAEVSMTNHDRIVRETADKRNELESYIYDMRDKVGSDNQLGLYGTEEEKSAFLTKNEGTENWLYEDGFDATKSVYAEKLAELKALGTPMEKRRSEAEGRASAISGLQAKLEVYQKWVNDYTDRKYDHITDDERLVVRTCCDETSAWMYEMLDKQGGLNLHDDPVLTVADISNKTVKLVQTCNPIMTKPVPPPPKPKEEPKPAAAEETKPDAPEGNGTEAEPMEGVEEADSKDGMDVE